MEGLMMMRMKKEKKVGGERTAKWCVCVFDIDSMNK
jgi:hypothetical protein